MRYHHFKEIWFTPVYCCSTEPSPISEIEKYALENYPVESVKIINTISVELPKAKSVRINITMPDDILARLDEAVSGRKIARSRFISDAVEARLNNAF